MTASNFDACLAFTLDAEGGFVDNPDDPGAATNMGITQATYAAWLGRPVTVEEVRALPKVIAGQIYKTNYWNAVSGDVLPTGVDLMVFDFGVNAGTGTSAKRLQGFLNVTQDGVIGPQTLDAVKNYEPALLIKWLGASQQNYYQQLGMPEFLSGWLTRTKERTTRALEMAA